MLDEKVGRVSVRTSIFSLYGESGRIMNRESERIRRSLTSASSVESLPGSSIGLGMQDKVYYDVKHWASDRKETTD